LTTADLTRKSPQRPRSLTYADEAVDVSQVPQADLNRRRLRSERLVNLGLN